MVPNSASQSETTVANIKANILIVDDQPDNLRTLSAILNHQGFKVRKAISGMMALETVRSDFPDLILLDIRMPQMDGYEVCALLKADPEMQRIPVIFLSALSDTADKVKAFSMGGADYITKPFQSEEVLARIQHQLVIQFQQRCLQQLNATLEQQVEERTAQLRQALEFEALLKRITDKVRDSLDEETILQTAVKELALGLGIERCETGVFNAELNVFNSQNEERCPFSILSSVDSINNQGLFNQLLQKQETQYCENHLESDQNPTQKQTILMCPIFDDHGMLGNLQLFKSPGLVFEDLEIRLVKQVANQCAIAIRQSRLYQEAQKQVKELQRLNQLKDDFLSTISHELRSPIANIKMVTRLLMAITNQGQTFITGVANAKNQDSKIPLYFQVLQDECERELHLIQDLLDLQHLNAGVYPLERVTINLYHWLSHVLEPFQLLVQTHQLLLEIDLVPDLPALITDASCLKRILTELLNNACKYTPSGGKIIVSARIILTEAKVQEDGSRFSHYSSLPSTSFPVALSSPHLLLSVTNTGIEIPATEYAYIFDKFYRIPSHDPWKHGGTGLGLALIKRITEYMAGSIRVFSQAGQTCFTVELPIEPVPEPPA